MVKEDDYDDDDDAFRMESEIYKKRKIRMNEKKKIYV